MIREEILGALRATPDRVEACARGLSPEQLARRPKEGEWSIGEILHHLLIGERDVILPRLTMRREHDFPQLARKDERAEERGDPPVQRHEGGRHGSDRKS